MPGRKLPDNWDEDTRFDGPEHWGMDERWKGLFPKSGGRADDDDSSLSDNGSSSRRGSDSLEGSYGDGVDRAEDTVEISKDDDEDDEDGFDALGSQADGHNGFDATSLRIGEAGTRKKIPDTAPAPLDDERDWRIDSSNRPSKKPTKSNNLSSGSSSTRARREEAEATARRWRHGIKDTEPAASCSSRVGVGRRVRPRSESGTPLHVSRKEFDFSSSEGEEEFDESEANITGRERSPTLTKTTTTPRRRKERNAGGLRISDSPTSVERSSRSSSSKEKRRKRAEKGRKRAEKGKEGGRAAYPLGCDDSSDECHCDSSGGSLSSLTWGGEDHDDGDDINDGIESIRSDSDDFSNNSNYASSAAGSGNEGYPSGRKGSGGGGGRKREGKESRRRSLSSPSPSHKSKNSSGKGKRHAHTKGSVRREGGRRDTFTSIESHRSSSSSEQRKGSKASTSTQAASGERERDAGGGASKRPTQSGGKKLRKVVPAKGDEHGWIPKGSGGGSGGTRGRRDPVLSFQPSQAAVRKNQDRSLTQSKINFPVVLDD